MKAAGPPMNSFHSRGCICLLIMQIRHGDFVWMDTCHCKKKRKKNKNLQSGNFRSEVKSFVSRTELCSFALKLRHQSPGTRSEACGHRQPFPLLIWVLEKRAVRGVRGGRPRRATPLGIVNNAEHNPQAAPFLLLAIFHYVWLLS